MMMSWSELLLKILWGWTSACHRSVGSSSSFSQWRCLSIWRIGIRLSKTASASRPTPDSERNHGLSNNGKSKILCWSGGRWRSWYHIKTRAERKGCCSSDTGQYSLMAYECCAEHEKLWVWWEVVGYILRASNTERRKYNWAELV